MNFLKKLVCIAYTCLLILSVICTTAAQDSCALECPTGGPLTESCIDCKIKNVDYKAEFDSIKDDIDFAGIIEDYINEYGIASLVEDHIGMSIGALIFVIIIVLSLPSLIIVGLLFSCCWAFNCCCFSKKYARYHNDRSYTKQPNQPYNATPMQQFMPVSKPPPPVSMHPPMNGGHVRSRSFSSSPTGFDPINNNMMIPRFKTKKPMPPPQQFTSYDDNDYQTPPSAWRNRTSGHFNPNFQQQEWGEF